MATCLRNSLPLLVRAAVVGYLAEDRLEAESGTDAG